jgi:hypothetical protein
MSKGIKLVSSVALLTLSISAFAHPHHHVVKAPVAPVAAPMMADNSMQNHWVLGVDAGVANNDWETGSILGAGGIGGNYLSVTTENHSFVANEGAYLGYNIGLTHHIALEPSFGYHHVNNNYVHRNIYQAGAQVGVVNTDEKSNIFELLMSGIYNFDNGANVFAQAGAAIDSTKITANTTGSALNGTSTNVSIRPEVGLGVGKSVSNNVDVYCKFSYIVGNSMASISTTSPTYSMINAGLAFKF